MCISGGKKCSFFRKFVLFSWNTRFEIRPVALLPTKWLFDYFMQYLIRNGKVNPKLFTILQLCCQGIYLFKVNNGNTKLIERRCSGVFTINFEHILHCRFWTIKYQLGMRHSCFSQNSAKRDENVAFSFCGRSNEYQTLIET